MIWVYITGQALLWCENLAQKNIQGVQEHTLVNFINHMLFGQDEDQTNCEHEQETEWLVVISFHFFIYFQE